MSFATPEGRRALATPAIRPSGPAGSRGRAVRVVAPPDMRRRGAPGRGLLGVFLGIAAAMAAIGVRETVVRQLPFLAGAYEAVGLPVNLPGLELRNVHARIISDGNRKVLVTEGEIVNIRRAENHAPPLALAVRGANGLPRYAWTAPAPKTKLAPGEAVTFRARLAAPPEEGVEVVVRFAGEAPARINPAGLGDLRLAPGADIPNPRKMP